MFKLALTLKVPHESRSFRHLKSPPKTFNVSVWIVHHHFPFIFVLFNFTTRSSLSKHKIINYSPVGIFLFHLLCFFYYHELMIFQLYIRVIFFIYFSIFRKKECNLNKNFSYAQKHNLYINGKGNFRTKIVIR